MKIKALTIENFRGIQKLEVKNLGDTIIIAGQNGSGKSCIFDAIRLFKSFYGGYHDNEINSFFGEFSINIADKSKNFPHLFNNKNHRLIIECTIKLHIDEIRYIEENHKSLLRNRAIRTLLPADGSPINFYQYKSKENEIENKSNKDIENLLMELKSESIQGRIELYPDTYINIKESILLEIIFSNYEPNNLGIIDYHGAKRNYNREQLGGINLNVEDTIKQYSQHTLYNYINKYNNIKNEMARDFIKELLLEKINGFQNNSSNKLSNNLNDLFEAFFPDKKFLGPEISLDGNIYFSVKTSNGTTHDLDELSSGEKEILFGYLRMKRSAPRYSIILIDEPELHLNPRLIRNLPEFYRKNLGESMNNQLWLVTHSDALIRETIGKDNFDVFHMLPSNINNTESQLKPLFIDNGLELVLSDLIGDLSSYGFSGKSVILEGGGDTDFDKKFISLIFSKELTGVNLISGTNKSKVKALHEILENAYKKGDISTKFYAITDRDSDVIDNSKSVSIFTWDVYHIENYLIDPKIIHEIINNFHLDEQIKIQDIDKLLIESAKEKIPELVVHRMRVFLNSEINKLIKISINKNNISTDLYNSAINISSLITKFSQESISIPNFQVMELALFDEYQKSLDDGTWKEIIPGREILKTFLNKLTMPNKIKYESFRNLIINKMADKKYQPEGMKKIIQQIAHD